MQLSIFDKHNNVVTVSKLFVSISMSLFLLTVVSEISWEIFEIVHKTYSKDHVKSKYYSFFNKKSKLKVIMLVKINKETFI